MTRQTENFLRDYFGVHLCYVKIEKNAQAEFLAGSAAPARPIARRMSAYIDRPQQDDTPIENHGIMTENAAARRIKARRATYNGDRILHDSDSATQPPMKERNVHFADETHDGNNGRNAQKTIPKKGILRNRSPAIPQGDILQHSGFDAFRNPQNRISPPSWQSQSVQRVG